MLVTCFPTVPKSSDEDFLRFFSGGGKAKFRR